MNVTNEKYESILKIKLTALRFMKGVEIYAYYKMIYQFDWEDGYW